MIFEIRYPDSITTQQKENIAFKDFLQKMTNRLAVGSVRYGPPDSRKQYLSRLKAEVKAYSKSGNAEQLFNIAVYAFLESYAPENKKAHFDPTVGSVTRSKFGGAKQ